LDLGRFERLLARDGPGPARAAALAVALTALAALLRAVLHAVAPETVPFAPFFVSTLLAALLGGALAGGVALGAALLTGWFFFLPPYGTFAFDTVVTLNLLLFAATQALIVGLAVILRAALRHTVAEAAARRQAEQAWQAKAQELEALMSLAPVGVWFTYDPEVRQVLRNRFAAEMLRTPPDSTVPLGTEVPDRITHVTLCRNGTPIPAAELPLQRAMRGEESRDEEFEAVFADGARRVLLSNALPLRDAAGRITGAISASLDITARKQAEAALRDAIAQRELLQREADHRIKNSLQIVSSVLRLQRGRLADPAAIAMLDDAIGRIAAVAEAHAALHQSTDLRSVDLGTMVRDLARHVGALNPDIAIRCEVEGHPVLDAPRAIPLGLVVSELLTNAVRHAYPPGVAGQVIVAVAPASQGIAIEVRDNGVGLREAARDGSLGTALVQSFAARIGATVETCSAPGAGTTVRLLVGAREAAAAAA
jgi:two-component sensor histidine kinase/PAS domain-containing protein